MSSKSSKYALTKEEEEMMDKSLSEFVQKVGKMSMSERAKFIRRRFARPTEIQGQRLASNKPYDSLLHP